MKTGKLPTGVTHFLYIKANDVYTKFLVHDSVWFVFRNKEKRNIVKKTFDQIKL